MSFLDTLEVGSKVAVTRQGNTATEHTIVRTTKTQVVLESGEKYSAITGYAQGAGAWKLGMLIDPAGVAAQRLLNKENH